MKIEDAQALLGRADLVQTMEGSVWLLMPSGEMRKLDFWADSCDQRASLNQKAGYVTAWRENALQGRFGVWHNVSDEEAQQ